MLEFEWYGAARSTLAPVVGALIGIALVGIAARIALRLVHWADARMGQWIVRHGRRPLYFLVGALGVQVALPLAEASERAEAVIVHAAQIALIVGAAWIPIAALAVLGEYIQARFVVDARDNLQARRVHTRFLLIRRTLVIAIGLLAFAGVLTTFPGARSLGTGILASAGIVGIAVGIAARPSLETLLAGLQLAVTSPINLDDVVIVEGEWGRIEEITATYVVVRIWDLRRLIVPVSYFLQRPFQNWTRVTADLLGAVTVDVDYRTPVEDVRKALGEIIPRCELWNGEFWNLQVVDAGERAIRLRVLVSAPDSSNAWDLRCEIREKLLGHLRAHHPESLPRVRVEGELPPQSTMA